MQQMFEHIFDCLYVGYGIHIKSWEIIILFSMCRYAQSCAFISVIELPRIPAYCPKYKKHGESLGKETKNHKNVVYPSMYMFRIFLRIVLSL